MRKLKLELGDLKVESFMAGDSGIRRGTVDARQYESEVWSNCPEVCPYSGAETGLCGCNTADFWCGTEDCPHTGMLDCYSKRQEGQCEA